MFSKVAQITLIEEQKRKADRVSVYLDGEFWVGMPRQTMLEHALKEGLVIDAEAKQDIERGIAEDTVFAVAVNLLSYRDRSEAEIRRRLLDKDFGEGVVQIVIDKLKDYSYLDDQAFAEQTAGQCALKGKGRRAAQDTLRKAGVEEDLIESALESAYGEERELEAAMDWLRRKPLPENHADRQKLMRSLASRGFSFDTAREAIEQWEAASA